MPDAHRELTEHVAQLERHYRNMQDVEFTVEEGQLYFLQTRDAKRPPAASVRFACDAVDEGLLEVDEALMTFKAGDLEPLLHQQFDPRARRERARRRASAPRRARPRARSSSPRARPSTRPPRAAT